MPRARRPRASPAQEPNLDRARDHPSRRGMADGIPCFARRSVRSEFAAAPGVACAAKAAWGPSGLCRGSRMGSEWGSSGLCRGSRMGRFTPRDQTEPEFDQGAGSGRPGSRLWSRSGRSLVPAWRRRACRCPPTMVAMAFALRVGLERTASRMKARRGLAGVRRSSAGEVNEVADFLGRGAGGTSTMPAGALPPAHPRSTGHP